ncbi:MAG: dephospho-CoA kinase [Rhodoluna sp.]|nr:dephospho-CoA kinase [Rhodoluna sp.]
MYLIGLTGGIAAGKSTVAKRWVELGAIEIDADQIAREVVEPGTVGLQRIREHFGFGVLNEDGSLDRAALGKVVFANHSELNALNAIVHPLVKARTAELLAEMPAHAIVIYNVPLLVEAAVDHDFDTVVTVEAPEEEQLRRLVGIRGMTESEAKARIVTQAKPVERAARADRILSSNQDIHLLLRDADALWRDIEKSAAAKLAGV